MAAKKGFVKITENKRNKTFRVTNIGRNGEPTKQSEALESMDAVAKNIIADARVYIPVGVWAEVQVRNFADAHFMTETNDKMLVKNFVSVEVRKGNAKAPNPPKK